MKSRHLTSRLTLTDMPKNNASITDQSINIHVFAYIPSLTAVNCGTVTNPTNGQVSYTAGTIFRQIATYSCNMGYNLVGSRDSHLSSYRIVVWKCTYLSRYVSISSGFRTARLPGQVTCTVEPLCHSPSFCGNNKHN